MEVLTVALFIINAGFCFAAKNVLFIVSDDMRVQLEAYNDVDDFPANVRPTMNTTNLDALAAKSLLLKRAYVQYAVCGPSRTSFLTGRRPDTTQVYDIVTYWRNAGGNFSTIPQYFKENGYNTVGMGKIFHPGDASGDDDINYSWSESYTHKNDRVWESNTNSWLAVPDADLVADPLKDMKIKDAALDKLDELGPKFKNDNEPFFLAVGFHKPHLPFVFPESFLDYYPEADIGLPDDDSKYVPEDFPKIAWHNCASLRNYDDIDALSFEGRYNETMPDATVKELRRAYYSSVSYIDSLVGQVIDKLDELDLEDDTIIAFVGDHGWLLGEHAEWCKHSNLELSAQAPMMIHIPGVTDSGIESDALVEFVDIFPTLVEAAGLDQLDLCSDSTPDDDELCREGESLIPLITNPDPDSSEWKDAVFTQIKTSHKSGDTVMGYSMRTDRYRYTEWVYFNETEFEPDWSVSLYASELYDHDVDHYENYNKADDSSYSSTVTALSQKLRDGWREALPESTKRYLENRFNQRGDNSGQDTQMRSLISRWLGHLLKTLRGE